MPVSCATHPETDYIFYIQEDVLQKYSLIFYDTITNGKQRFIMWHVLNQNKERSIVPTDTGIGKSDALERCVAEVTTTTENVTTVSFQFEDILGKV